jgi:hypothetical protein
MTNIENKELTPAQQTKYDKVVKSINQIGKDNILPSRIIDELDELVEALLSDPVKQAKEINKDALNNLIEKLNNEPLQLMPPAPNYINIALAANGNLVVRTGDIDRIDYLSNTGRYSLYLKNCDDIYYLTGASYNDLKNILTSGKIQ